MVNMLIISPTISLTCGTPTKYLTRVLYTPVAEPSCANCTRLQIDYGTEKYYIFAVNKCR
jgi:hypothetical protein